MSPPEPGDSLEAISRSRPDSVPSATPPRRVRVAHLIHSLGPGGAESVLVELAQVAPTAGLDLLVVALSPTPRPVHADALRALGIPVVLLELGRWDPRAVHRTVAALRHFRPDVIHTHLKHADLVGAAAGAVLRTPVISTLHVVEDAPATRLAGYKRTAGLMVRRRAATRTITLSTRQLQWYRQLTGSDAGLVVLPNGVADPGPADPATRNRIREELGAVDGRPLIMSASLMRPEKGHDLLLDAVALLPDGLAPVVALAGDGELRGALEERVAASPVLRERVRFLGYRDDVPSLLGAADLVLHTSLADALPTTVMQALAVGVPVVATDVGGIPDIVGSDAGILTPTDARTVADAVARVLLDRAAGERMGRAGRRRFDEVFSSTVWVSKLRALYDSVLEDDGTRSP